MLLEINLITNIATIHGLDCGAMAPRGADLVAHVPVVDKEHAREVLASRAPGALLDTCSECRQAGRLRVLVPGRSFDDN